jgi:hypothetical protein
MEVVVWVLLSFLNAVCAYVNYEDKSYKSSMFSCFAFGFCLAALMHAAILK